MRRRGCLISLGAIAGLLLICCVLGYFVAIPRLRDSVSDSITEQLSTEVADQLAPPSGNLEAGTYTLSVADLQQQIDANTDSSSETNFGILVTPNGMTIDFDSGSQTFGYTGVPVVRNGKVELDDMQVDNEALGWIMPADRVASIIENGINDYVSSQGMQVESLELGDNEITLTVVPAN